MKNKNIVLMLCSVAVALIMMSTVTARPVVVERTNVEASVINNISDFSIDNIYTEDSGDLTDEQLTEFLQSFNGFESFFTSSDLIEFLNTESVIELFLNVDWNQFADRIISEGIVSSEEYQDVLDISELQYLINHITLDEQILATVEDDNGIIYDIIIWAIASIFATVYTLMEGAIGMFLIIGGCQEMYNSWVDGNMSFIMMIGADLYFILIGGYYLYDSIEYYIDVVLPNIIEKWNEIFEDSDSSQIDKEPMPAPDTRSIVVDVARLYSKNGEPVIEYFLDENSTIYVEDGKQAKITFKVEGVIQEDRDHKRYNVGFFSMVSCSFMSASSSKNIPMHRFLHFNKIFGMTPAAVTISQSRSNSSFNITISGSVTTQNGSKSYKQVIPVQVGNIKTKSLSVINEKDIKPIPNLFLKIFAGLQIDKSLFTGLLSRLFC